MMLNRYSSTENTHYKVPFPDVNLAFVCCECMRNCGVLCLQRNNYKELWETTACKADLPQADR